MLFDILGRECVLCGYSDIRALQFDHINGGGRKEQRIYNDRATMVLFYVKNPELAKKKLQVLCANCNWIKRNDKKEFNQYTVK